MPEKLDEYVAYYLDRLEGPDAENAFHSLIEAPKEAVPLLIEAYHQKTRSSARAAILDIVAQFRDPTTIPFLGAALRHDSEEIWKHALDGLVMIDADTDHGRYLRLNDLPQPKASGVH